MNNSFVKKAVEHLKKSKFRITQPRMFVIELLAKSQKPLSAQSIHENLTKNKKSLDLVSVYRILEVLQDQGLIHKDAESGNYFSCLHCESCSDKTHVFLKCSDCNSVREIDYHGEIFSLAFKRKLSKLNAKPTQEMVYLNDLCSNCS